MHASAPGITASAAGLAPARAPRARAVLRDRRVRLLGRWIAAPVATVLVASFAIFAALTEAPGDPVSQLLGSHASAAQVASLRHSLGLDQPLPARYWHWLVQAVHGNLGNSLTYRSPVWPLLTARIPVTLFLVGYAGLLTVVIGIGLGILAGAVRRLSPVVATLSAVSVAVPGFVAAILLVSLFSLKLGWLPAEGTGSGFGGQVRYLTLPAVSLAVSWAAYLTQVTRSAIAEERQREHVATARLRGIPPAAAFRRHVLRNAGLPILTIAALTVAGLFAGTVIVEEAFGINGVGSFLVSAVAAKDYNVVQAISVILVLIFVVVTTLLDVTETLLDPRLRDAVSRR
jgi:peptide/nickel transport system permease protein